MNTPQQKTGFFSWYFKTNLLLRILAGLLLGAVAGLTMGESILWLSPLGTLFVRLLNMIVMPLVISTLVVGAASISPAHLGRSGVKIVLFYLLTSAIAVTIGLAIANVLRPGDGLNLQGSNDVAGRVLEQPSLMDTFMNIIPTNVFAAVSSGQVLPTIFFAILFGIALSYLRISEQERIKSAGDTLFRLFDGMAEIMFIIVRWVLEYAPIGVFALIAVVFAKESGAVAGALGMVVVAMFIGFVVHFFLAYGSSLVLSKLSLKVFMKKARPAMLTGFVTRSSGGTLPVSMRCTDNLGVSRKISSFTLPLGATINMDGTAIYQGICALFITYAVGMDLDLSQQLTIILTAVLASIGTAGAPGAGAIMLLIVLKSVGLEIEDGTAVAAAYAMILGIDAILDMGRTALNVSGDMVGSAVVAKSEGELDIEQWNKH